MMKAPEDVPKLDLKGSSRLHKFSMDHFSTRYMENNKPVGTPHWYVKII